jgi:hypothetical protein
MLTVLIVVDAVYMFPTLLHNLLASCGSNGSERSYCWYSFQLPVLICYHVVSKDLFSDVFLVLT